MRTSRSHTIAEQSSVIRFHRPMDQEPLYRMLLESLALMAAPADQQIASLPNFAAHAQEVMSTFDDAFLLVPQLVQDKRVSASAELALKRIALFLESEPITWSWGDRPERELLRTEPFFSTLREMATGAFSALGEPVAPPTPDRGLVPW